MQSNLAAVGEFVINLSLLPERSAATVFPTKYGVSILSPSILWLYD